MSVLQAEVFEAFRSIDVPEDKAIRAATALSSSLARVEDGTAQAFSKRDADIEGTRRDVQVLKTDMAVVKWMLGILLTMVTAVLFRLFTH